MASQNMWDAHSGDVTVSFGKLRGATAQQIGMVLPDVRGPRHWFAADSPAPVCSPARRGV